jgi:hypothetical protein
MDIHHKIGYGVSLSGAGLSLILTYKDPSQLSPATKHDFVVLGAVLLVGGLAWPLPGWLIKTIRARVRRDYFPGILFCIVIVAIAIGSLIGYVMHGPVAITHHQVVTYIPGKELSFAGPSSLSPPPLPKPKLISTAFHEVFKCQYHWPVPATPKERAEGLAKIKAASKTIESVFGVSVKILTTDDSVGMELTPVDPSNIRVFGPMVKKLTEVVRYLNDDYVIITITYDAPGLLGQI